ncbi:phage baseplate assembly protein [Vibrio splendidus]|uniref:phage baseplate assembly protein domain-containing protein n=1 Tax=Vibrio splendidus TaxID=29497 RepID=UPI00223571AB|nr:phage baseplate assembly protein [Vibrio splendidus]MCW4444017.1 phage baseplate assembly protein [Vibrio splendidus]
MLSSVAQKQQQQRLMARIKNITGTGTVTGATTSMLQIKTATGRTNDKIKRIHNYGFMSRPLVGAKTYNLFIGGVTARGITVNVEDERHQIELEPGEVAVLDDKGNLVHFTANGIKINSMAKIEVTAKQDITVNTPKNIIQNGKNIKINQGTGAITCESICPFMGKAHVDGSSTVTIGKS